LKAFFHGGADAGYRSQLLRIRRTFFRQCAEQPGYLHPWALATKITDLYLKDKVVSEAPKQVVPKADSGAVEVDPAVLATYSGNTNYSQVFFVTISVEGNILYC